MFRSKLEQAVDMLVILSEYFSGISILAVCDSWFGNNGLFAPARKLIGTKFHILSRLRSNIILYICSVFLYGKKREVWVASTFIMLKTLRCPVRAGEE